MREFKGKCEWGYAWIIIGAVSLILSVYFCVLFGIGSTRGLKGGVIFAVITGVFLGGYCIVIILSGVSRVRYTKRPVLRIYEDRIEFIERSLFFKNEWHMLDYADIRNFSVAKITTQDKKDNYMFDTTPGTLEFVSRKNKKAEIQLDIEECYEAARLIIKHLTEKQIDKKSEVKKEQEEVNGK